jgi:hypothetical protein
MRDKTDWGEAVCGMAKKTLVEYRTTYMNPLADEVPQFAGQSASYS